MQSFRGWLNTRSGKIFGVTSACAVILGCAWLAWYTFRSNSAASASSHRIFIDSETGKSFEYTIKIGDTMPVRSPFTGNRTGYPAEACYWTVSGEIKETPTYVLLNTYKGDHGPTFCPDCGRLVTGHNPRPHPGSKPPPTRGEYLASHHGGGRAAGSASTGQ